MIDDVVQAIRAGRPVILPTDTVYGLCTTAYTADAAFRLYALKGRPASQPTALLASDVDAGILLELLRSQHQSVLFRHVRQQVVRAGYPVVGGS